jgi:hypothetical protein
MEKKINLKVNDYQKDFINNLQEVINNSIDKKEILSYLHNYKNIELTTEDFKRRKRIKNTIPDYSRCIAKKGNGNRCTRKKKDELEFCGTHEKSTPYGFIDNNNEVKQNVTKIDIWYQEINGIYYYIDKINNVYLPEDIISNKTNPRIIATWKKTDTSYLINEI